MTLPLPPSCPPLVVTLEATTVRIKVYAPEYGTYKFLIQLRAMTSFPGNPLKGVEVSKMGGTGSNPGGGSSLIGGCVAANRDINSGDWVTVYYGMETLYTCTTMHTDADYECRYFCVNCQGAASESSPIQSFSILHRDDISQVLNHRNAEQFFTIECTGDICVGDTVLMTERLFSKPPKEDTNYNSNLNSNLSSSSRLSRSGSFRAIPGGPKNTRLNSAAMDRSTMSVISGATSSPLGTFIGERTIAAYVVKDNYRSCRDELNNLNIVPKDLRRFGKYRRLWLELVWQKSSNEACKRYELKPGAVIERQQGHLEQFEVLYCSTLRCIVIDFNLYVIELLYNTEVLILLKQCVLFLLNDLQVLCFPSHFIRFLTL
jgi:hypothetical protein